MIIQCSTCQQSLEKPPSRIKRAKIHYCSVKCRSIGDIGRKRAPASAERKRKIGEANFKGEIKPCPICKKPIKIAQGKLNCRRFCSMLCYQLSIRRKHDAGEYVRNFLPNHPSSCKNGLVREHRRIAEEIIGRPLTKEEIIHHINEIRNDNRPENLYLFKHRRDHTAYHMKVQRDQCKPITKSNLASLAKVVK